MEHNVGGIDRGARIVAGVLILASFFILSEDVKWWALIGLVPLVTGLVSWCPLYQVFGVGTCAKR
jgi:hypothetical protein